MNRHSIFILSLFVLFSLQAICQTKTAYLNAAEKAFLNEDYSSALNFYLNALEFDEEDASIMYSVAECNRRLFEYSRAIEWYKRCLVNDEKRQQQEAYLMLAETYKCILEFENAKLTLHKVKQKDSSNSHFYQTAVQSEKNLLFAESLNVSPTAFEIKDAGKFVNSAFSDFAPLAVNDSVLYFSSLRFASGSGNKTEYVSKILQSKYDSAGIYKATLLHNTINNETWHNCNASVSPDNKVMVFSRCNYNEQKKLICALYESVFKDGYWNEPVRLNDTINVENYTSTQPSITLNGIIGYQLFFVSDRAGGYGKNDIYIANRNTRGEYANIKNAGSRVNTAGNEITPFYNSIDNELYFSTDSLPGLGVYDIFKINIKDSLSKAENLGLPFNSGYNDLYFTLNVSNRKEGFLSSNRTGSMEVSNTCCYDIYRFKEKKAEIADSIPAVAIINPAPIKISTVDLQEALLNPREYLPLKLYFDNDYPDPKTRSATTRTDYQQLYSVYFQKLEQYIEGYKKQRTIEEEVAINAVEKFFAGELQYNYNNLEKFTSLLSSYLKSGKEVTLTIQGCASPLAESDYNIILSKRRIASLANYWKKWNNEELAPYFKERKVTIIEEAAGENLSSKTISDRLDDIANSVYNPAAARERRIEILNITIDNP